MIKTLSSKDPNDTIKITINFTNKLRVNTSNSVSIQTANVTAYSSDNTNVTVSGVYTDSGNNYVTYYVSGGNANSVYKITTTVTLTDSQVWNRSVYLPVQEK